MSASVSSSDLAAPQLVQRQERGGRVGAPAPEPGGHRDPLVDLDHGAGRRRVEGIGERERRDQREVRPPAGTGAAVSPDLDTGVVGRPDARSRGRRARSGTHQALDLVVAVLARPEHAEEHVDLGVRVGAGRRGSRGPLRSRAPPRSAANVGQVEPLGADVGLHAASRPARRRPRASIQAESAERVPHRLAPLGEPLVDDRAQRRSGSTSTGGGRAVEPDETDVDLRARPEHVGRYPATRSSASARYATRTLTAPYASSPGRAASRSPTSRCTITTVPHRSSAACSSIVEHAAAPRRCTAGSTDHPPASGARARSPSPSVIASATDDPDARVGRRRPRSSAGSNARSNSIARTSAPVAASATVRDPRPGPDLDHAVPGADPGVGHDRAREVRVGQEVLAEGSWSGRIPWRAARSFAPAPRPPGEPPSPGALPHQLRWTLQDALARAGASACERLVERSMIASRRRVPGR